MAGKRLGKEDERHLWPHMLRAIREIRPRWVVGENVLGLVNWNGGLVFDEVQADLEAEGYEVQPYVLPAVAVDAPHRRDRVWFVAHSNHIRSGQQKKTSEQSRRAKTRAASKKFNGDAADSESLRINREAKHENRDKQGRERGRCDADNFGEIQGRNAIADSASEPGQRLRFEQREFSESEQRELGGKGCELVDRQHASDAQGVGLERKRGAIRELEGRYQFSSTSSRNLQYSAWQNFPTQSPVCSGDDGIPDRLDGITFPKWRNESIKGYGNAVVPQVVHQIFKAIGLYESTNHEPS
jgi:DNA (cytosine-5)-methyltransferase 1